MATSPAVLYDPSPAALEPLMETFWSPQGWRDLLAFPGPNVMAPAVEAGVMFSGPRVDDHGGWVRAARDAARAVSAQEVGEAFLASLSTRRLDLRSALGSYAVARLVPEHPLATAPRGFGLGCIVCGQFASGEEEDLNILSFERFKWGGVRRDYLPYAAFDLEQFAKAPRLKPTRADIDTGRQLLDCLRQLPGGTTAAQAVPQLKMIKGNKAEREVILDILGVAGILRTAEHPGYANAFIPKIQRSEPPLRFIFGHYPISWWTAADGVNLPALQQFLPQLT
jgi:hypothetical protein